MFKRVFVIMVVTAAVGGISSQASAEVPYLIPVVGKLTDASGTPLQGDHVLAFALYDVVTGGTPLWNDTFSAVAFTGGLFNVYLGSQVDKPLEVDLFLGAEEIWIEIQVDNDNPMTRVQLASVPWALECEQLGNISADVAGQNCNGAQYLQGWDENGPICINLLPSVSEENGTVTVNANLTVNNELSVNGKTLDFDLVPSASTSVKTIQSYGGLWGGWYPAEFCSAGTYVCGIEVRFEGSQGGGDDTALNAVKLHCCPFAP